MMNANYSLIALLLGLALRLVLPVAITLVAIYFLRKLDAHWQQEAEQELAKPAEEAEQSWDLKDCPIEKRSVHPLLVSARPCWQTHRLPSGYLNEECLSCAVFRNAPARVAHAHI
jgi:hypothetical protein